MRIKKLFTKERARVAILSLKSNIYWLFFGPQIKIEKDEWYFICPFGLGDTYFVCALASELLRQKGGIAVNVLVRDSQEDIPALFPMIKKIYPYNKKYNGRLLGHNDLRTGKLFWGHPLVRRELVRNIGSAYDLLGAYKVLFELRPDSTLDRPVVPAAASASARARFDGYSLSPGRTVILCPEANSVKKLDPLFWKLLADELKKNGWTVCTNAIKDADTVPGTTLVQFPLIEALPMAELAGWVISLRSGFCDLVSSSRARLSIVYPVDRRTTGDAMGGYGLVGMGLSRSAKEYLLEQGGDYADIIEKIVTSS
jgi:hypothetical protein